MKAALIRIFSEVMIRSAGSFCVGGRAAFPALPGLRIDGVGEISFPLAEDQAEKIKVVGTQAPFGKGPRTVVDVSVRNTIQIELSKVKISSPQWQTALQDLVQSSCVVLGIDDRGVRAELYKLLLYEPGGLFKPHQDSEKALGMFGTLVVQFPSSFSGGRFLVRHGDEERVFHMGTDDSSCSTEHHYVAHYADCEHEIEEVTRGYRLAAVYSLIWTAGSEPPPSTPGDSAVQKLADCLKEHLGNRRMGVLLTHEYTKQSLGNFGIRALKLRDRAIAGTLLAASELMKSSRPDDELELLIAKAYRLANDETDYDRDKAPPNLSYYEEFMDTSMYAVDGRPRGWQTGRVWEFDFFRDIVNLDPKEKKGKKWVPDRAGAEGWRPELQTGRLGNEATADIYTRYVLLFCRKEVSRTWGQPSRDIVRE